MTDNRNDVSENENEANDVFYNQSQVVTTAEKKKRAWVWIFYEQISNEKAKCSFCK